MTKEELQKLRQVQTEIKAKQELLAETRATAYRITQIMKEVPTQKTNEKGGFEQKIIKVMSLTANIELTITETINKYAELYINANNEIEQMKNRQEKIIMQLRYLANKSWEEISGIMHLSKSRIYHIHGEALLNVAKDNS